MDRAPSPTDHGSPAFDRHSFRVDISIRPDSGLYAVVVTGDIDPHTVDHVRRAVEAGFDSGLAVVVRLDGVAVFGAVGSRLLEDVLHRSQHRNTDLTIEGVPHLVSRVLDIVGVHDDRIRSLDDAIAPLSPIVFDAVIAGGALRTREAICITSADVENPRIVFVNEAFTTLTGYQADDVLGRNPSLLQGALTDRAVLDRLTATLRRGGEFDGEAVNYRADGTPFWMNWRILPLRYGSHHYFMAVQRDGTQIRQLSRQSAARTRMTRIINATDPPLTRSEVLEALGRAVATVVEPPDVAIATALTDGAGDVAATNLEGMYTDPVLLKTGETETHEADGTVTIHLPFDVEGGLRGHVLITGLHRDWLQLTDVEQLKQLCDDCTYALANAEIG